MLAFQSRLLQRSGPQLLRLGGCGGRGVAALRTQCNLPQLRLAAGPPSSAAGRTLQGTLAAGPHCSRLHLSTWRRAAGTVADLFKDKQDKNKNQQQEAPPDDADAVANAGMQSQVKRSMSVVRVALAGNLAITAAKFAVWFTTGSSALLAETIHSFVDSMNQGLLLLGLMGASNAPDTHHQYGYGRNVFFWSLVSALGTFFMGAGISLRNSVQQLFSPSIELSQLSPEMWLVLGFSFVVDGWVLKKTFDSIRSAKPANETFLEHFRKIRDPTTLAVFMEDSAACLGVVLAIAGIGASQLTGMPIWDSVAGVSISCLLGGVGFYLARLNQQYLLGQAVESEITEGIRRILLARPAIDSVQSVQSQWVGPFTFSYKAEVDFDGTYLAAKLLDRYQDEFLRTKELRKEDLRLLLAWYAEDVMRTVEREVRDVEAVIRAKYPEAQYIELEPDSKEVDSYAIDDSREMKLRRIEMETINQMLKMLRKANPEQVEQPDQPAALPGPPGQDDDHSPSKR